MQQLERLLHLVPEVDIEFDELMPKGMGGFNNSNEIILNGNNNYYTNVGNLAEEIGHYLTSTGDISNYKNINNMKQEFKARRVGIRLILPLERIIECYELSILTEYDMCMHLEVTPEYLSKALEDYKRQFGAYVKYGGYRIEFEPLNIKKE